jgi:lysophospholipase L1-like esterase
MRLARFADPRLAALLALAALAAAGVGQKLLHRGVERGLLELAALGALLAALASAPATRARLRALWPALLLVAALAVAALPVYPAPRTWLIPVAALAFLGPFFDVRAATSERRPLARLLAFRLIALSVSIALGLAVAEVALRARGTYRTWSEKNGGAYASPYTWSPTTPWVFVYEPGSVVKQVQPEFTNEYRINSEGLPDVEHAVAKPEGEYRIAGVGDSFTLGQGAPWEQGWLKVLERELDDPPREKKIVSLCAGVAGSDPVFGYQLVRTRLVKYKPDLVLLVVNGSDILDVIARGGMDDRYDERGLMHARRAPWFEPAFARSHLVRAFVMGWLRYDWFLLSPDELATRSARALEELARAAQATRELGRREGFETLVVLHPFDYELHQPRGLEAFAPLRARLDELSVPWVDLTPWFDAQVPKDRVADYFWPLDRHCRPDGYRVFAHGVARRLESVPGFPQVRR